MPITYRDSKVIPLHIVAVYTTERLLIGNEKIFFIKKNHH